jgi:ABC-type Mn2+/Zn2+ transport system permease subunit
MKEIFFEYLKKVDIMKTIVGLVFITVFSFTVFYILRMPVPKENTEIAHFMMGEVSGVALTIATYYFGSSKGSQEKAATIQKQMEKHQ